MERSLTGGPELLAILDTLPDKLGRNIARGGARAGARVIAGDAYVRVRKKSGKVARSIGVSTRAPKDGVVAAKIRTKGQHAFIGLFLEKGTVAHLISVREDARPKARGKLVSIRTLNRAAKETGSLEIGGKFVGASVIHPGSKPYPFMLPALEAQADAAVNNTGAYIRARFTKEGLDAPFAGLADDQDEPV